MTACWHKSRKALSIAAKQTPCNPAPRGWKKALLDYPVTIGLLSANGLVNQGLAEKVRGGVDFLYADHAYFARSKKNFRLVRGELHLTRILDRPDDRLKRWEVRVRPYRQGSRIIVIPPSKYQKTIYGADAWLSETLETLHDATDRQIIVKTDKLAPLSDVLADAWAVVTFASSAGVQALLAGAPVFAGPYCPCQPVTSGRVGDIEKPVLHDLYPWLRSLAYCQWSLDELDRIDWEDYKYR